MTHLKISDMMQDLTRKVDAVYRHGTLQERYSAIPRDYGEGFSLTESEAHTLGYICEMGEATVTDLAEYSFRTKGSISKMLKKLEEKGLVQRCKRHGNLKWIYVSPTEQGKRANLIHQAYDRVATSVMLEELLKVCSMQEIESFYKVTEARVDYLARRHMELQD